MPPSPSLGAHAYRPAGPTDSRAPCPALNTLANHGLLPRDGRNIGVGTFVGAIRAAYNFSGPLAWLLAFGGWLLCRRHWWSATMDLGDLALHNAIEHDASLVHADAPLGAKYAPTSVDRPRLADMLAACPAHGMGWDEFVKLRVERETASARDERLDTLHRVLGAAESVLALHTLRDAGGRVPRARLEQWFGEERFPEGWEVPRETQGLVKLNRDAGKLRKEVEEVKEQKLKRRA